MTQAPRSQNEITNVVKKFPGLLSWVQDLQEKVKLLENSVSEKVIEVKETAEDVLKAEFEKFKTSFSTALKDIENLKKLSSLPKEISDLKKELDLNKNKVKTLEEKVKALESKNNKSQLSEKSTETN